MEKYKIGTVLVVDDDSENIDLLTELLDEEYEVSVATNGSSAVIFASELRPHLILLDIVMSDMDGYNVCRILKQNKMTQDIPVIFLSSLSSEADQESGLNLGAVDYITKPFSPCLVRARVRNHVNLRRAQLYAVEQLDMIQDAYQKLRELEAQRDDMAHMLLHDLRAPLTSMLAGLDFCLLDVRSRYPEIAAILENAKSTGKKLSGMLTTLLDVSRLESGTLPLSVRECTLSDVLQSSLRGLQALTEKHKLTVVCARDLVTTCDPDIMERVITNLLMNALQHTPEQGEIVLAASLEKNWIRITLADTGPGIPKEYHETIFEKFGRITTQDAERGTSAGLGLTFCKLAVDAHGGSIHVESIPGRGACFIVRLPHPSATSSVSLPEEEAPKTADESPGKDALMGANITVFLISNDQMLLKSLTRYLETRTKWSVKVFFDGNRAVRTAMTARPDMVLLDIDMQQYPQSDIFSELESVVVAQKGTIAYYTEMLLPEETKADGYSLAMGGQPVIPKRLPLAKFLDVLVKLMAE